MKIFTKGVLSVFATTAIITGLVYAANNITTVTTQSIGTGDTMGVNWFQSVNDRLPPSGGVVGQVLALDANGKLIWKDSTSGGASTSGCGIITKANFVDCFAGRGKKAIGGTMMPSLPKMNVVFCGNAGYHIYPSSDMALEVRSHNGGLWVYGINFPVPYTGTDGGGWNCVNFTKDTTPRLLCDISSGQCNSLGGIFGNAPTTPVVLSQGGFIGDWTTGIFDGQFDY